MKYEIKRINGDVLFTAEIADDAPSWLKAGVALVLSGPWSQPATAQERNALTISGMSDDIVASLRGDLERVTTERDAALAARVDYERLD